MQQYEYRFRTFTALDVGKQIDIWGSEGWRVVSFTSEEVSLHGEGSWAEVLLMRPYERKAGLYGRYEYTRGPEISAPLGD